MTEDKNKAVSAAGRGSVASATLKPTLLTTKTFGLVHKKPSLGCMSGYGLWGCSCTRYPLLLTCSRGQMNNVHVTTA